MIKLVTFDLDDTLWAVSPVITRANQTLYTWLDTHAPRFTERFSLEDFATLRQRTLDAHPQWAHSVTAIRQGVLRLGLSEAGYPHAEVEALAERAFAVFLEVRNEVELFEHSRTILASLGQRYQLAALSNGNADIEKVGLGDYFDFALSADKVGRAKPDPLMFAEALRFAGVRAEEALHVGDHPEHDVQGAQQAGFHSLWVNLQGLAWPGGTPPTLEVHTLEAIPQVVAQWASQLR